MTDHIRELRSRLFVILRAFPDNTDFCATQITDLLHNLGWSPPIPSRLRAVERCLHSHTAGEFDSKCLKCNNAGTIERPLTPEEMAQGYENIIRYLLVLRSMADAAQNTSMVSVIDSLIVLPSGARVILTE